MQRQESSLNAGDDLIGSATTPEEIVEALARRGCSGLTALINLSACSNHACGWGGFCDVYQGALHNGTRIAIKSLRIYNGPETEAGNEGWKIRKRAARELYHWSKLRHRNVLPLMGLATFRGQISMVSEWMENGNLASYLRLNPDANRNRLCMDICEGLCHIHMMGMVHGDLKAANVMVSPDGTAMIADFGNTQLKEATLKIPNTTNGVFSVRWAAPELLLEDSIQVSKEADVYAYGMTVLEILTGKVPYEGSSDNRVFILVAVEKKVPSRPDVHMCDELWALLNLCWSRDPPKRPKITSVRDSLPDLFLRSFYIWFTDGYAAKSTSSRMPDLTLSINLGTCRDFLCAGKGGYCDVYQGTLNSGTRVAIKSLRVHDSTGAEGGSERQKLLKRAARELCDWSKLNHRNVLPLLGLATFRGQISILSEWMDNGTLLAFLRLNPRANRNKLCMDVCEGLCHIHMNGMANVMISPNGTAVITDLGHAQLKDPSLNLSDTTRRGSSLRWAAPELLLADSTRFLAPESSGDAGDAGEPLEMASPTYPGIPGALRHSTTPGRQVPTPEKQPIVLTDTGPQVSKEADVYAFGMVVLEALTGNVPFEGISDNQVFTLVAVKNRTPSRPNVYLRNELWDLLKLCWSQNPSKRPEITSVRESLPHLFSPSDATTRKRQERARLVGNARARTAHIIKSLSRTLEREIITANIRQLVNGISERRWTATDVISVYISQAIKAHEITNCLTEVLFGPALDRAKELDLEFERSGQLYGPLHGVPLTFKDQYEIKDYDNTIGFTHWVNQKATQDAELVAQARSLGGVPIAKTNVPQTMMSFECVNPLWGRTVNPYNHHYTCGGSSGGEAAVLRFSGSALGIGSDVGGGLRIPAAYCGVYSLKPTGGRFSGQGAVGCVDGFTGIPTVYGPIARSVADVKYVCETFFGLPSTVPSAALPPAKYRTDLDLDKTLRIGYYTSDRFIRASPACQRAVRESVEALERAGHECVEINPPDLVELLKLFVELTSADGYETMLSHLQSDKPDEAIFLMTLGPRLPTFVRTVVSHVAQLCFNDTSFSKLFNASRTRTVQELWAASAARLAADRALQNHLWSQTAPALGLDAIVCPVQAIPGIPHGATKTLTPLAASTIAWNVVECPVGVVPVTRVDPQKDALPSNWLDRREEASGHVLHPVNGKITNETASPSCLMEKAVYGSGRRLLQPLDEPVPVYDAEKMKGLPIGVQIVGRPWEDERVIYVMEILDRELGERGFGPGKQQRSSKRRRVNKFSIV